MIYRNNGSRRLSSIILFVISTLFVDSRCIFAQDKRGQFPSVDRSHNTASSVRNGAEEHLPKTDDLLAGAFPDAPMPTVPGQNQSSPPASPSGQHLNQFPVLPPRLTFTRLTADDKFRIYTRGTFGPPAVILPVFGAGLGMLNPPSKYPKEWKDGADGFGRLYGARVATITSRRTAGFLTDVALHEDPRYLRSTSTNAFARTVHALAFTIVDKRDSGQSTIAFGNFAAAAAGGFVGMGFLPDGWNDATHAGQRAAGEFGTIAVGHVVTEFEPEWGPWAKRIHLPKILPAWWVPQGSHRP
jgi:hypothetical protein